MAERLSNRGIFMLAVASAFVTANAYYIHPIIGRVADSFGVGNGLVGIVPALNQFALALGVLLLLPLGDRMSNRRLVSLCLSVQVLALLCMAITQSFLVFVIGSTILGFFTITPYLLPAYASKRVEVASLGFVTAVLTAGVLAGVQVSRLASGVIAEYLGWRVVYWVAASLMAVAAVALPLIMQSEIKQRDAATPSYGSLLSSLYGLALQHRRVVTSGLIQGLNFGMFIATWMGIGLHLTSDRMNLGTDIVGYLAAFSGIAVLFTPMAGRYADRYGPERARLFAACAQLIGIATYALTGSTWW
ncbi:MAG: MFS transporter, partial [Pseudomonadota bacterium]